MKNNTLDNNILRLMPAEEHKKMLETGRNIDLSKGEVLFHYGDSASVFYLIKSGKIKLHRTSATGREKVFKTCSKDDSIAVMLMFIPNSTYPMTAQAEQDSELIAVNKKSLLDLATHSPQLAELLLGCMGRHMLHLINTVDKLSHPDAGQRLIIHLAELYQAQKNSELFITLPDTKLVLASQLGMQPETLSRLFRKFKEENLLLEKNHKVYFPDFDKLCHSVNLTPNIFKDKN
ncbi:MAG: CRP/FNR family transcriptional regulator, dissimilatory nitrate respiration regulator [Methyloprofundus sp.]|nr:MAG: CRP/FNR family transcriptional regulator, dissimilatory nitrate respiration regulator [Methyloprofundus sp.]